jgi:beta-glucanase (GH16 family)
MGRRMAAPTLAVIAVSAVLGLSACSPGAPIGSTGATATAAPDPSASSASDPTPEDAAPTLQPAASATDNLPFFDSVNVAVTRADPSAGGRAFIDALAAAGFDTSAMEVTADTTTLGDPADSIQFAVRFAGECLVGQFGPKSGGYHSAVRPALGTGGCLVGRTRAIDW